MLHWLLELSLLLPKPALRPELLRRLLELSLLLPKLALRPELLRRLLELRRLLRGLLLILRLRGLLLRAIAGVEHFNGGSAPAAEFISFF